MTKAMPFLQKVILLSYDPRLFPHGRFSIESQTHSYSRKTTSIRCPSRHKTTGNSSPT